MHDTGWFGGKIVKKVGKVAKKAAKTVSKAAKPITKVAAPVVKQAMKAAPIAQTVLKNTPLGATPMGMAAGAALGGLRAAVRGDSLEKVAWAAAEGGAPAGIDRAIAAARAIRNGNNVLKVAVSEARKQFIAGTPALAAFDRANTLLSQGANSAALNAARNALPPAARHGFDAAVGTLSQKAKTAMPRALGFVDPIAAVRKATPLKSAITRAHPTLAMAQKALKKHPILAATAPAVAARALNLPVRAVQDAQRAARRPLKWRPSSVRAANFIRRFAAVPVRALTLADTGSLVAGSNPPKWTIDSLVPYQVAQKLTGNSARWKELLDPLNPGMTAYNQKNKDGSTVTLVKGWTIGKVINLPPSWFPNLAPIPVPTPTAPTAPSSPGAIPVSLQNDLTATIKAKATLVAWSKTDGAQSSPFPDYGANLTDTLPQWTERDGIVLHAFSKWWNPSHPTAPLPLGTGAVASAPLTQAHADALHAWAESKAGMPLPTTPTAPAPTPSAPSTPTVPTTPPSATPSTPSVPTMPTLPSLPSTPTIPTFPPIPTMPPAGDIPPGAPPQTIPTSTPTSAAKSDDGLGLALLAAGAALAFF